MAKPWIACHMMMSVDGRIDCGMTVKLRGNDEYYAALDALDAPNRVSGRVTAELEMAAGRWAAADPASYGKPGFSRVAGTDGASGYEIVFDTHGVLAWDAGGAYARPVLVDTSEQAPADYLAYLEKQGISWIACGKGRIDVAAAVDVLAREFGVKRMAVVGGGNINAAFLDAGLLDEVSILLGPGVDARAGMAPTFDGLPADREPFQLGLKGVTSYDDGALWIRYDVR